jgi:ubiquinone/menaquinone biosynthesis C-methylase UbiE
MTLPDPDQLLDEQIEYYRQRAPEYDDWWEGVGVWRRSAETDERWRAEQALLVDAILAFDARGDVLEIAAGTGNLTRHLVHSADRLTALDTSPEALEIARAKLNNAPNVDLVVADVFAWEPPKRYDAIVFGFWLSHVPPARTTAFWELVDRALAPGGRVFLVDNRFSSERPDEAVTSAPGARPGVMSTTWLSESISKRTLSDGREYWIVKRDVQPTQLEAELAALGWTAHAGTTGEYFVHATGLRASSV